MSHIIENQGEHFYKSELFYNLTYRQLVRVSNSIERHVWRRADISDIRISDTFIKRLFHVVYDLAKRSRMCMNHFEFVRSVNGKIRVTQDFINHMMRLNDSLIFAEEGWKDMTVDIDNVCTKSEETVNSKYAIIVGICEQRTNAIRNIDYTGVMNMTNNSSFRELDQVDAILSRVVDFKRDLSRVAKLNTEHVLSQCDAAHCENVHRLNIRTQTFKSWKLYSCKPIYPDCMSAFSFYDDPLRTEFDANFVMPEDIGRIITEFVGHEFISNVRCGLVIAEKGRDAIRTEILTTLGKWRKNELLNFINAVAYNKIKVSIDSNNITGNLSNKKNVIIDYIMTNFDNKELYYPFYRDVMILTPIIKKQRAIILKRNRIYKNRRVYL